MDKFVIYTDGASRGNPGPSGLGVAIYNKRGVLIEEYSQFLGEATNNEAEYQAVIFALKKFKLIFGKKKAKKSRLGVKTDSDLLAKQINGEYKIENERLQRLFLRLWNLRLDFGEVKVEHVGREENEKADRLANAAIRKKESQNPLFS